MQIETSNGNVFGNYSLVLKAQYKYGPNTNSYYSNIFIVTLNFNCTYAKAILSKIANKVHYLGDPDKIIKFVPFTSNVLSCGFFDYYA